MIERLGPGARRLRRSWAAGRRVAVGRRAEHPPFDRTDLEAPVPPPESVPDPPEPVFSALPPPSGLGGLSGKKKHAEAVAAAEAAHEAAVGRWRDGLGELAKWR